MKRKLTLCSTLHLLLLAPVARGEGTTSIRIVDFDQYLVGLDTNSFQMQRENFNVAMAKARDTTTAALPDPMVQISKEESLSFSVTQEIPWPTAYFAQNDLRNAEIQKAELGREMTRLEQRLEASLEFLAAVTQKQTLLLALKNQEELMKIRDYTESRRKQGLGQHGDMLQIQIDIELAKSRISSLQRGVENLKDALRQRAGDSAQQIDFKLEWPKEQNLSKGTKRPANDLALKNFALETDVALASLAAKRASYRPSLSIGASQMQKSDGMWMTGAMLAIRLPIFSWRTQGALSEQESVVSNVGRFDAKFREISRMAALRAADRRIVQAEENLQTLQQRILPLTQEHLKLTLSEFAAGKGNLDGLIAAERKLLALQTSEVEAHRQLCIEHLMREAIDSGLIQSVDTTPLPELSFAGTMTSSGMTSSGMTSMGNRPSSAMKREGTREATGRSEGSSTSQKNRSSGGMSEEPELDQGSKSGGMGM